jgi:UPF0716 family protein affecting phage T7 exclusion
MPLAMEVKETMTRTKPTKRLIWGVVTTLAGLVFFCLIPGVFGVRAALAGLIVYICVAVFSYKRTKERLD